MSEERTGYEAESEADNRPAGAQGIGYAEHVRALTIQLSFLPAQIRAAQMAHLAATAAADETRREVENARYDLELETARILTEAYASGEIAGKNEAERKRAEKLYLDNHSAVTVLALALDAAEMQLHEETHAAEEAEIEARERTNTHRSALANAEMLSAYLRYLATGAE